MKILLDTQILLWAAAGSLPAQAAAYIADSTNTLLFSSASIWEVVIKSSLGRADFVVDPAALYDGLIEAGYVEVGVLSQHALHLSALPTLHKDPFDRILLAQGAALGVPLLTSDMQIAQYPGSIIYVE